LTVQAVTLAALPLAVRVLAPLPDRGYSLAKVLGVLMVGLALWWGTSLGLLRNEQGGAWAALIVVAAASWLIGRADLAGAWREVRAAGNWRHVLAAEVLFACAFLIWVMVRAYDPAVDHTEEPMDLMFMQSIWASPTFPPHDAWLAGYAIGYYYLGYWLVTTLGRLANTPPEIAYNVGQAVWFGLLLLGSFGVVTNLLAYRFDVMAMQATHERRRFAITGASMAGGVLGAIAVGVTGNVQAIMEWLYAQGVNVSRIAAWIDVYNFPENAKQSGLWYIGFDWWWWRTTRVVEDLDLLGERIQVIDEFPIFSYMLGDNHPHVLAMPVVLLAIGLAMAIVFGAAERPQPAWPWSRLAISLPGGAAGLMTVIVVTGSLAFLNTWDFPPYLLLIVAGLLAAKLMFAPRGEQLAWRAAGGLGVLVVAGMLTLYLPYFLSAQSQAGGFAPNLFNPTRVAQFLAMLGTFVPGLIALAVFAWRFSRPSWATVGQTAAVVVGVPIGFLLVSTVFAALLTPDRAEMLGLPPGVDDYLSIIVARWVAEPWTVVLIGALLTAVAASLVVLVAGRPTGTRPPLDLVAVLLIAAVGLLLVYGPEFAYLRDSFGTRMNTIFKFYYQGWLLFALVTAYVAGVALRGRGNAGWPEQTLAGLSVALVAAGLVFPAAAVYGKTGGFGAEVLTLDAGAYLQRSAPDVAAAVAWVRANTTPNALVLEAKGRAYDSGDNRISTLTGRPTLVGWDGHERQWRGGSYGQMAEGRDEAIETIYARGSAREIAETVAAWGIDYVFVGPVETSEYGISSVRLAVLERALAPAFASGDVRILRRR
jgi:YYY domain-containing protein